jgi:hypothetical protein
MKIEVSVGEILDKLSILQLKLKKIEEVRALKYVKKEHNYLLNIVGKLDFSLSNPLYQRLEKINAELWDVEDSLRLKEKEKDFGPTFVDLARSVYKLNDQRFFLKKEINKETSSAFEEQKNITT